MEGLSLKKIYALIREDLKSLSVYDFMRLWKILFEFLKEKVIEQLNKLPKNKIDLIIRQRRLKTNFNNFLG